jgi:hypothetical protein
MFKLRIGIASIVMSAVLILLQPFVLAAQQVASGPDRPALGDLERAWVVDRQPD